MSKRANPTLIGAFVVGAVVLAIVGLLLLGGGELFHRKLPFVLYLQGDVGGLSVGSPVKFQGVQIGSVSSIRLRITPEGATTIIPVTIQLDASLIESISGTFVSLEADKIRRAIEQGLRARLETESLITGQRYIALLIAPDTPPKLLGLSKDMAEIPTLPTAFEELRNVFDRWDSDVRGLVTELTETSRALRELIAAPDTKAIPASLVKTLDGIDGLVAALHAQVDPLASRVSDASQAVQQVASGLDTRLQTLGPTLESLRQTAQRTTEVEGDLSQTLATVRTLLAPDAPLVVQLQTTLQEFGATARSLRALSELVERDPSALLRGKDLDSNP